MAASHSGTLPQAEVTELSAIVELLLSREEDRLAEDCTAEDCFAELIAEETPMEDPPTEDALRLLERT